MPANRLPESSALAGANKIAALIADHKNVKNLFTFEQNGLHLAPRGRQSSEYPALSFACMLSAARADEFPASVRIISAARATSCPPLLKDNVTTLLPLRDHSIRGLTQYWHPSLNDIRPNSVSTSLLNGNE
jgi:hypothetical protein